VLLLVEVPGAALLAWLWLGQVPVPASLPGLALLVAGVLVVLLGAARGGSLSRRTAERRSRPPL
jgi:drug/metabolite transporter (DMT)-like permease